MVTPLIIVVVWTPLGMKTRRIAGIANSSVTTNVLLHRRTVSEWLKSVWPRFLLTDFASNPASYMRIV